MTKTISYRMSRSQYKEEVASNHGKRRITADDVRARRNRIARWRARKAA